MVNSTDTLAPAPDNGVKTTADVNVSLENFSLRTSDRCDACGAQAYFRVVFAGNQELTFCNHHYHKNEGKLLASAVTVYDESAQLTPTKSKAGNGFV